MDNVKINESVSDISSLLCYVKNDYLNSPVDDSINKLKNVAENLYKLLMTIKHFCISLTKFNLTQSQLCYVNYCLMKSIDIECSLLVPEIENTVKFESDKSISSEKLKNFIEQAFILLDEIDTASDRFKPVSELGTFNICLNVIDFIQKNRWNYCILENENNTVFKYRINKNEKSK